MCGGRATYRRSLPHQPERWRANQSFHWAWLAPSLVLRPRSIRPSLPGSCIQTYKHLGGMGAGEDKSCNYTKINIGRAHYIVVITSATCQFERVLDRFADFDTSTAFKWNGTAHAPRCCEVLAVVQVQGRASLARRVKHAPQL